jgi:hypothetical protein
MRYPVIAMTALALLVAGCGEEAQKATSPVEAPPDPRLAIIAGATSLAETEAACQGLPAYPKGDTKELTQACSVKLTGLIKAEKIPDFESGLSFFKEQLDADGRTKTIVAVAAGQALTDWLREKVSTADESTLRSWLKQIPSSDEDTSFTFQSMRSIIGGALPRKKAS